jgi:heptosyltransferase I
MGYRAGIKSMTRLLDPQLSSQSISRLHFQHPPQHILIIKPSSLGDVTHALPILHSLRRHWSESKISWLVSPACKGLLEGLQGLDEVIVFDRRRFGTAWRNPAAALDLIRFNRDLRKRKFDLVIDLQGLFRSAWLSWQTGAKVRIGFANAREFAPLFYTHRVPVESPEVHAVDRYLKIAHALGCDSGPVEFRFPVTNEHRQSVDKLLTRAFAEAKSSDAGKPCDDALMLPYAVLLPGANWPTKRWPAENFESLIAPLRSRFGLVSILAGGPEISNLAPRIPSAMNLIGQTNLLELVALLERAAVVVANDSGPMHIAAALNRPLVTVFGPTNPIRTGPYGRPDSVVQIDIYCSPCYSRNCSHQSCMKWLRVEQVLNAVQAQLKQG